jgi:hypothetical protein
MIENCSPKTIYSAGPSHVPKDKDKITPTIYDIGNGIKSVLNLKHVSNSQYELMLDADESNSTQKVHEGEGKEMVLVTQNHNDFMAA